MKKSLLMLLCCLIFLCGWSQQVNVKGVVLDKRMQTPMTGATIKSAYQTVVSDTSGHFSILAKPGQELEISYVGMSTLKVIVPDSGLLTVELSDDKRNLEEVVITGYQAERRKDLLGAISSVDMEQMNKATSGSAMKALQGQIPGVYITTNGSPRGAATVRIRGIGTLNNNDPLYIIDGVPTKSGLHTINQADIESMQVLKDASAASIYGVQAANGVIVITTKKGKPGKVQVDLNTYWSSQRYTSKIKMLDTQGYAKNLWQAYVNAGSNPNATLLPFNFEYHTDPVTGRAVLDNIQIAEYLDEAKTLRTANTDWFNEISRTGIIQNYDLSVSRGSETGSSLFSMAYLDNKGLIKESGFKKISLRFNSDYHLFKRRLTIGENFNIVNLREFGAVPINEAIQAAPMIPVRTVDGNGWGGPSAGMNDRQNPVRLIEDNKQNGDAFTRMLGNVYVQAKLFRSLTLKSNFGLDYGQDYSRNILKSYQSGYLQNPLNKVTMNQWHSLYTIWTNTFDYSKTFFTNHKVNVFGGMEYNLRRYTTFTASRENYVVENEEFMWLDAGAGQKDNSGSGAKNALLSYFGKLSYMFSDKYLASFTIRQDGSSRFGKNNRFGVFPSFSAGWQLGEEKFIKKLDWFDQIKLRYSWGINGNQEIDNKAIYDIYSVNYATSSYDISGVGSGTLPSGYVMTQTGNPDLKWETTTQSNFGVDFSIKNSILYGSVDYFIKKTEDILIKPSYIAVLGEGGSRWLNGASMENSGVEIALGSRGAITDQLSFNVDANFSTVRNKVTYLPDAVVNSYGGDSRIGENILGRTLGSFYGYVADGIFQNAEEVSAHAAQVGKGIGRIRYKDLNGDNVVDDYDRTWIGNPLPDFTYGLNLGLQFKGIDLSIFFQGINNIDLNNEVKRWTDFWAVTNAGSNKGARLLDAWTPENTASTIPAVSLTDANNEARLSTYYIENGSYLKIRNIQLGYELPQSFLQKFSLNSLRFYATAENVALLHKSRSFTGLDPENVAFGYPNPLVLTFGLNLKF